jgi:hypothetical protein
MSKYGARSPSGVGYRAPSGARIDNVAQAFEEDDSPHEWRFLDLRATIQLWEAASSGGVFSQVGSTGITGVKFCHRGVRDILASWFKKSNYALVDASPAKRWDVRPISNSGFTATAETDWTGSHPGWSHGQWATELPAYAFSESDPTVTVDGNVLTVFGGTDDSAEYNPTSSWGADLNTPAGFAWLIRGYQSGSPAEPLVITCLADTAWPDIDPAKFYKIRVVNPELDLELVT